MFAAGLIIGSLVKRVAKPAIRGVVKASVGIALDVRQAVQAASEDLQDMAAEAAAESLVGQSGEDSQSVRRPSVRRSSTLEKA
ncbi:DUF5132 domain-containing protein [Streptomyces sp. NBC_01116]|uniref:DUF5132 domain-containing protein n=1 Tax=Streptomyces sp. NBC_01116 TaxID=2903752 RepID=UPI00352C87D5